MIGLVFLGGVLFGSLFVSIVQSLRMKPLGSLRMDYSDPDGGPYLFLELSNQSMGTLENKKYVVLRVNIKNAIGIAQD